MQFFLLTGVVLFGSFILSVLLLQRLADRISMCLWQTVPQPSLRNSASEIDHVIAAIITATIFGLLWRDHPLSAIITSSLLYLLLLAGGVARVLLLTRRQMLSLEGHQFYFEQEQLCLTHSEKPPERVIGRLLEQKHPSMQGNRWEFSSVAVELFTPHAGLIARNIYYDGLQASRMLEQLQMSDQVKCFDVALLGKNSSGEFLSLRLGRFWVPLLCGPLVELPPQVRAWWKKLLETNHQQPCSVQDLRFGHYLHPLHLAAENANLLQPELAVELNGLEQLISQSNKGLSLISGDRVRSAIPEGYSPYSDTEDSALILWRKA